MLSQQEKKKKKKDNTTVLKLSGEYNYSCFVFKNKNSQGLFARVGGILTLIFRIHFLYQGYICDANEAEILSS